MNNEQQRQAGSERGGLLFNGKSAKEWHEQYQEVKAIAAELEAKDKEIKKHEELEAYRDQKLHPLGVGERIPLKAFHSWCINGGKTLFCSDGRHVKCNGMSGKCECDCHIEKDTVYPTGDDPESRQEAIRRRLNELGAGRKRQLSSQQIVKELCEKLGVEWRSRNDLLAIVDRLTQPPAKDDKPELDKCECGHSRQGHTWKGNGCAVTGCYCNAFRQRKAAPRGEQGPHLNQGDTDDDRMLCFWNSEALLTPDASKSNREVYDTLKRLVANATLQPAHANKQVADTKRLIEAVRELHENQPTLNLLSLRNAIEQCWRKVAAIELRRSSSYGLPRKP